ncbi:MAG: hypothetical protein ABEJ99_02685 [Candidatus Nanohaloarchaea archaeon]
MEATITAVKENPLLDRREVEVSLSHEGEETPSKEDVKDRIAAENDLDPESIEVGSVYTGYGKNSSKTVLKVFDDFEYSENLEVSSLDRVDASPSSDEELERNPVEESKEERVEVTADYEEAVSGTITEAKDAFNDMDSVDWDAAIKAEKDNKNRTTLIDWLEGQREG